MLTFFYIELASYSCSSCLHLCLENHWVSHKTLPWFVGQGSNQKKSAKFFKGKNSRLKKTKYISQSSKRHWSSWAYVTFSKEIYSFSRSSIPMLAYQFNILPNALRHTMAVALPVNGFCKCTWKSQNNNLKVIEILVHLPLWICELFSML